MPEPSALSIGLLAICYAVIVLAFSKVTASSFKQMAQSTTQSGDVHRPQGMAKSSAVRTAKFGRFLSAIVGLAAGFVLGLAIAIYLDGGGLEPRHGWQTRLIIAMVVAGIAGLLGLVSGPPRW